MNYVQKVYEIKSNPVNASKKAMAKSLLNNLLGRFGISLEKPITEILTNREYQTLKVMHKVTSEIQLSKDRKLVSYIPKLDYDLINSHGLDFLKVVAKYKDAELQPINTTSIVISAAITAYARIHITNLKLEILKQGGNLYYSDTDSIVTDIELQDSLVSPNKLGLLKLEHVLDEAIFISNKIYWMCDIKSEFHVRAKGIKSKSLSYADFLKLLNNRNISTAVKTQSKMYWDLGYVSIENKNNIKINSNSYTKRYKLFNSDKRWVDTKPIFINNIDKDLVVYQYKNLVVYNNVYIWDNKKIFILNKSSLTIKDILRLLVLLIIIPVSSVALILTMEEGEFTSDEFSVYDKSINYDTDKEVNTKNNPSTDTEGNIKVNEKTQIVLSAEQEDDYKPYVCTEENTLEVCIPVVDEIVDLLDKAKGIERPNKSLYEGFEDKLLIIQSKIDKSEDNNTDISSPTDTESYKNTYTTGISSTEPSPDYSKDKFSPNTLKSLEDEIKKIFKI